MLALTYILLYVNGRIFVNQKVPVNYVYFFSRRSCFDNTLLVISMSSGLSSAIKTVCAVVVSVNHVEMKSPCAPCQILSQAIIIVTGV